MAAAAGHTAAPEEGRERNRIKEILHAFSSLRGRKDFPSFYMLTHKIVEELGLTSVYVWLGVADRATFTGSSPICQTYILIRELFTTKWVSLYPSLDYLLTGQACESVCMGAASCLALFLPQLSSSWPDQLDRWNRNRKWFFRNGRVRSKRLGARD